MALSGGGFGRGRRFAGAAEGLLTSVMVLAFVGALVYAASRPAVRQRIDLTREALYALTPQTRQVLADLPRTIEAVALLGPENEVFDTGLAAAQLEAIDYVRNLLREYELASGGDFRVRFLNRFANLEAVEALRLEEGIQRINVILLRAGDRRRQVFLEELVTIDRGFADLERPQPAELRAVHGEGPLTSALLGIMDETPPVLAVLQGYGGARLGEVDVDRPDGLGLLAEAARGQGFDVRALTLAADEPVPDDVDVVLVAGPDRPLGAGVGRALEAFHARGGGLLLAPDPRVDDPAMDALLAALGTRRERAVLVRPGIEDPQVRMGHIVTRFDPSHPVSAPIARQGLFAAFFLCSGVGRHGDAPADLALAPLAVSPPDVFGDSLAPDGGLGNGVREPGEPDGERVLVAAVEREGRAVVASGASFLGNRHVGPNGAPANMDLALGALNWLAERDAAVEARPRELFESRVELTPRELGQVTLYVLLAMPLAGVLLGAIVWWVRRR